MQLTWFTWKNLPESLKTAGIDMIAVPTTTKQMAINLVASHFRDIPDTSNEYPIVEQIMEHIVSHEPITTFLGNFELTSGLMALADAMTQLRDRVRAYTHSGGSGNIHQKRKQVIYQNKLFTIKFWVEHRSTMEFIHHLEVYCGYDDLPAYEDQIGLTTPYYPNFQSALRCVLDDVIDSMWTEQMVHTWDGCLDEKKSDTMSYKINWI